MHMKIKIPQTRNMIGWKENIFTWHENSSLAADILLYVLPTLAHNFYLKENCTCLVFTRPTWSWNI